MTPCDGDTSAPAPAPVWGAGLRAKAPSSRPPPSSGKKNKPPMGGAAASVGSSARGTVRDMGTPLAVHYRARDGPSLGAGTAARQRAILNRTAKYGHAGLNSQDTPPPLRGLSPGLAFEGQAPNAKVVPRNVLLVQRAPLLPENAKSWNKSGGVKLWAVRSPRGSEVLHIYEGIHKSAVRSHSRPGWHLRACIEFLHTLATMHYCLSMDLKSNRCSWRLTRGVWPHVRGRARAEQLDPADRGPRSTSMRPEGQTGERPFRLRGDRV